MSQKSSDINAAYAVRREASEREDVVMFINACFAATGQQEYYGSAAQNRISIDFLHRYVLANYRTVYRRVLAASVNDFNRAKVLINLLAEGAPNDANERAEEGALIAATLRSLPANRVYALFARIRRERINNRRTRATIHRYLQWRRDPAFDGVKYRNKLRVAVRHAHAEVAPSTAAFLFNLQNQKRFENPLYDAFLRSRYAKEAIYELPYSVAEGFAARRGIPRDEFLRKIEPRMTHAEKQRLQQSAKSHGISGPQMDLSRTPLTKLALYVLSLPMTQRRQRADELHEALVGAAKKTLRARPLPLGKTALVLDCSRSTWGSRERRRRPLAVAVALHYLVSVACTQMHSFVTPGEKSQQRELSQNQHAFLIEAAGQTDLASPLLSALRLAPDQILILSDGYENDPAGAVGQIVHAYRERLAARNPLTIVHANPVYDGEHFSPKPLADGLVTIGLRDAEDLGPSLGFARFAAGEATQLELEDYLRSLAHDMIEKHCERREHQGGEA
ncbi:MAG: hypothetical protein AAFU85_01150 [Planctomycetota bacterium]